MTLSTSPNDSTEDYCRATPGADYDVHQHALGVLDVATGEWSRANGEPYCVVIPADAIPKRHIGQYVTAYASDLGPALTGQVLVMHGIYESWDAPAGLENVTDLTGIYRVRPNAATRVGSAGSSDHVTLGRLGPGLILDEITWWDLDEVLRMEPDEFGHEVHRWTMDADWQLGLRVVR